MGSEIHVLSNVNIAGIRRHLEERLPGAGVRIAPYDHVYQELLDASSLLNAGETGYALIYLDARRLFGDESEGLLDFQSAVDLAEKRLAEITEPISAFIERRPGARVIVNTLAYPTGPPQADRHSLDRNLCFHNAIVDAFNLGLCRWKSDGANRLIICDWAARVSRIGGETLHDERLWYIGRMPLSARGMEELAALYAQTIRALSGLRKKVLVLDLDNTLWGGVIGEDGISGITLGEDGLGKAYRDFQVRLRSLKERGVLLAIASKNNEADVDQVFEHHPMMVLTPDDFVARKIGWRPKPEMLVELSKELSLGPDSFVFIDDSPAERDVVRAELLEIAVPEFPSDPFLINGWFADVVREHFDTLILTEEDRERTEMYRADVTRREARGRFDRLEDFYRGLGMEMRVWIDHREQVERLAQLTQKTNQLNLTTRRYEVGDIEGFISSPDARLYDCELLDRYGSNGIVGLIIARLDGASAEIDTFLMSCRVIGRNAESALFGFVVNDLRGLGIESIRARFIPTAKNAPARDLLDRLGFEAGNGFRSFMVRPMDYPDYIHVRSEHI